MPALQTLCKQNGNGLDIQHLDVLRRYILGFKGVIERPVILGYSYYMDCGVNKIMKILITASGRIYLLFNFQVEGKDLIYLNELDRTRYRAGKVKCCYVGTSLKEALTLIAKVLAKLNLYPDENKLLHFIV